MLIWFQIRLLTVFLNIVFPRLISLEYICRDYPKKKKIVDHLFQCFRRVKDYLLFSYSSIQATNLELNFPLPDFLIIPSAESSAMHSQKVF